MKTMSNFFRKTVKLWRGLILVFALLLAIFVVLANMGERYEGFINDALGTQAPTATGSGDTNYFPSKYGELNAENCKKLIADENAFNIQAMEEGAVLLRNKDNALPLSSSERSVTLFGNNVKDPVYATNAGGSSFKASRGGSILDAFKNGGFEVNETLYNAYEADKRVASATPSTQSIGEQDISFYTDTIKNSWASKYNDVALIMFTRFGGEGVDLSTNDVDGVPLLSFHKQEADLVKMVKASGKFGKIVVLINSPYPMDIEWIEDYETYGVDACIAFGAAGDVGFIGVVNLIKGDADFSGHLTDTYATSSLSAPAMRNFGDFTFSNHGKQYENKYVVYAENIYVGYKYYETRYQDQVLGINDAASNTGAYASKDGWNYAEEMAYTFGYGLSYSNIEQEVVDIKWDREKHTVTAKVKVTNKGVPAGSNFTGKTKAAVQLYVQCPYESGQAEKSAIQLIGFTKTGELEKDVPQTVEIVADDYLFAAYDETAANGADATKKGCYVFDEGSYYFAIGNDAHDALNNVLAKRIGEENLKADGGNAIVLTDEKGAVVTGDAEKAVMQNLETYDNTTHARSASGEIVCNRLQEIDYNYYKENAVVYLTRSDWKTYPVAYTGLEATEKLKTDLDGKTYQKDSSVNVNSFKSGVDNDLVFVDMRNVDYDDDETWNKFLDQLTLNNLATICGEKMGNPAIVNDSAPYINKPYNNNSDGPKGLGGSYVKGDKSGITCYVDQVVMASTFNLELSKRRGELFAEDALYGGFSMVFGPGADWHRTAYAGRNSEYYSEDANMSFLCGAAQCRAMQDGGLISAIKHFVGNDQETNRHGVATFANEQSFREGSLRCFEGALRDDKGGSLGTMTCFNRVGATAGAASHPVLVEILRGEWGFKGVNLTDSSKDASDYVYTEECIMGGTDMFNNDTSRTDAIVKLIKQGKDGQILKAVREINKHFYYAYSRSNLINGYSHDTAVDDYVPWWKTAIKAFIGVFGALAVLSLAAYVTSFVFVVKDSNGNEQNKEEARNE